MKQILVATDLSERSDRAIDRAVLLAKLYKAQLTVLHVIDEDLPAIVAGKQKEAIDEIFQQRFSPTKGDNSPQVDLKINSGKDWLEIMRCAQEVGAELIILGLHRERGLNGLFRGTTIERVVRKGELPVLVVKNVATRNYRNVIVGVDFSVYSRRAVEFALGFSSQARLHLVHAYDIPFKTFMTGTDVKKDNEEEFTRMVEQEMKGFLVGLESNSKRINQVVQEGLPHEVIQTLITSTAADLLVLGTHGRTGVAHAFLGSVAESFLTDPPCDVVAVKAW